MCPFSEFRFAAERKGVTLSVHELEQGGEAIRHRRRRRPPAPNPSPIFYFPCVVPLFPGRLSGLSRSRTSRATCKARGQPIRRYPRAFFAMATRERVPRWREGGRGEGDEGTRGGIRTAWLAAGVYREPSVPYQSMGNLPFLARGVSRVFSVACFFSHPWRRNGRNHFRSGLRPLPRRLKKVRPPLYA